jgi:hypothetical protein
MDRGVLHALVVVKCLVAVPCALLLAMGCTLNPQGEDPGYDEGSTITMSGGPGGDVFTPGPGVVPGSSPGGDSPNDGISLPTGASPGATMAPVSPAAPSGPELGPPTPAVVPSTAPSPTSSGLPADPGPVPEPSGPFASGGSPGAAASGGAGGASTVPGEEFDGGPFNYASPRDAGMGDAGLDAGVAPIEGTP